MKRNQVWETQLHKDICANVAVETARTQQALMTEVTYTRRRRISAVSSSCNGSVVPMVRQFFQSL